MKQKWGIVLLTVLSIIMLFSCSKENNQEAVKYHGEIGPDVHGWVIVADYEKKGDDVISANFDCLLVNKHEYAVGDLKSDLSKRGIYNMKVAGAKMDWHEQAEVLASYIVENQSFDDVKFDESGHDVDGVTSASIHFEEFAVLF